MSSKIGESCDGTAESWRGEPTLTPDFHWQRGFASCSRCECFRLDRPGSSMSKATEGRKFSSAHPPKAGDLFSPSSADRASRVLAKEKPEERRSAISVQTE